MRPHVIKGWPTLLRSMSATILTMFHTVTSRQSQWWGSSVPLLMSYLPMLWPEDFFHSQDSQSLEMRQLT